MNLKDSIYYLFSIVGHAFAKFTRKYYFEDYIRVYPKGVIFNRYGIQKKAADSDIRNFKNHRKFYIFASQFVKGKTVADVGCGSGYGCQILKRAKAKLTFGADASSSSIQFAKTHFNKYADFSIQSITNMKGYQDNIFDVTISNEVLEHIKEYQKEELAVKELQRITKPQGLIIIGTPNSEMLYDHGFSFNEIYKLMKKNFTRFVIFENALIPFNQSRIHWEKRLAKRKTGIIISEKIDFEETQLPKDSKPLLKKGLRPGRYKFNSYLINTKLLHNTHSWIIIAIND